MASTDTRRSRLALSPEATLLLATAGPDSLDPAVVELWRDRINWTLFLQLVAHERAEAIVAPRLARLQAPIPAQVHLELKAMAIRSDVRMALLSVRLDETLAALAKAEIPVMLLKGAALGRTVYRSLPRRPMLDIDLLIPVARIGEAREVALATGWATGPLEQLSEFYEGHFHLPPLHDARGALFNLELHSALFAAGHPFVWPLEDIWARSIPLPGSPVRVPRPEDLLLHIALHYAWSHVARLGSWRAFRDVRMLAESGTVDWEQFTRLAVASGGAPAVYWTLRFARRLSGAAVPLPVEQALRPAVPGSLISTLERHLAGQWFPTETPCPSRWLDRSLWKVAMRPMAVDGVTSPWARDPIFQRGLRDAPLERTRQKVARHLTSLGGYARYFKRVALGRSSRITRIPGS